MPDKSDKTGMYSKPGRVSVEMFQLLQLKDEILYNKKKEFKGQEHKDIETENLNSLSKLTPLAGLEKGKNEHSL